MNRCRKPLDALLPLALCLSAGLLAPHALAQSPLPQTQNEAVVGGRHFPVGTLRGRLTVVQWPEIRLDGQSERLSPGARIRDPQNMLVMPAAITGQTLRVNYRRDAAGLVNEVWILSAGEVRTKRASADRPLLNFWPFAAASGPRDDGKTPFDQLPRYGE